MSINVNGVTLPDIPVVEGYPYAIIVVQDEGTQYEGYLLVCMSSPFKQTLDGGAIHVKVDEGTGKGYIYSDSEWMFYADMTATDADLTVSDSFSLKWSNHDILNADTGEIYFPSSVVAEPEYGKIRRAIIRGASNAVRRKTGRTDKFPPEQLEYEIDSIVTADNALVLKENERIYQVGNAESILSLDIFTSTAVGTLSN